MAVQTSFNKTNLDGQIGAVQENPASGNTVWQAITSWLGGFRSQATIRDFAISMDEPDALGGSNTALNMVEVVLGA